MYVIFCNLVAKQVLLTNTTDVLGHTHKHNNQFLHNLQAYNPNTTEGSESHVPVLVLIRDVNDNPPVFNVNGSYTLNIPENTRPGVIVSVSLFQLYIYKYVISPAATPRGDLVMLCIGRLSVRLPARLSVQILVSSLHRIHLG